MNLILPVILRAVLLVRDYVLVHVVLTVHRHAEMVVQMAVILLVIRSVVAHVVVVVHHHVEPIA